VAVLGKQNNNAQTAPVRRAQYLPTGLDFFPDVLGMSRVLDSLMSSSSSPIAAPAFPAIDISEKDGNYVVEAALPGFRKEDVTVEITSNQITISGEHNEEQDDKKRRYSEIRRTAFSRTLVLPRELDPDTAKATFENGVLKIIIQPTSPIGAKKVQIEAK
jgi:HSP20 family protein